MNCLDGCTDLFYGGSHRLILSADIFQGLGFDSWRFLLQAVLPLQELLSSGGIQCIDKQIKVILGQISYLFSVLFQLGLQVVSRTPRDGGFPPLIALQNLRLNLRVYRDGGFPI